MSADTPSPAATKFTKAVLKLSVAQRQGSGSFTAENSFLRSVGTVDESCSNCSSSSDSDDGKEHSVILSLQKHTVRASICSSRKLCLAVESKSSSTTKLSIPSPVTEHCMRDDGTRSSERRQRISMRCFEVAPESVHSAHPTTPPAVGSTHTQKATSRFSPERSSHLRPPNSISLPTKSIAECSSFVGQRCLPHPTPRTYTVVLHVYDLSNGMLKKHSTELVGFASPGVYHSGVVCYGIEFYFEGGIGCAASGRTRFGSEYKVVKLGDTTTSLPAFMQWLREKETRFYQLHDYHPVRHNCHHFTSAAAEFLLGVENPMPQYLFTTIDELVKTDVGKAVHEVMLLTSTGIQGALARIMRCRVAERQQSLDIMLTAAAMCGILVVPPTYVTLFRVDSLSTRAQTVTEMLPFVQKLVESGFVKRKAIQMLRDFSEELCAEYDTITPSGAVAYADLAAEALMRFPLAQWGPILNSLRVVVLHKQALAACAFHANLISAVLLGVRDFPRLLPDGRLSLLRFACNLSSGAHGAVAHHDERFATIWVSLVGMGLMDSNGAVVYAASCLALNLVVSISMVSVQSLQREVIQNMHFHPLSHLTTLLLYNLRFRCRARLPEPSFNMLLTALLRIMCCNEATLEVVVTHWLRPQFFELIGRAETNESRALICIMKTVEDLYRTANV